MSPAPKPRRKRSSLPSVAFRAVPRPFTPSCYCGAELARIASIETLWQKSYRLVCSSCKARFEFVQIASE